jgi:crotonobetainyl-CoA:carnitine CoA-transferase CaiB-like acyl-CoA transferase
LLAVMCRSVGANAELASVACNNMGTLRPVGAPALVTDPDYAARSKNRDALNAVISTRTEKSTDTWVKELNAAGVPSGPIYRSTRCSSTRKFSIWASHRTCPYRGP